MSRNAVSGRPAQPPRIVRFDEPRQRPQDRSVISQPQRAFSRDEFQGTRPSNDAAIQRPSATPPAQQPAEKKPKKKGGGGFFGGIGRFFGRVGSAIGNTFIRASQTVIGGAVRLFGGKVGPHSPLPANMRTFAELTPNQQRLLGPDGQRTYDSLPPRNRAAFIVLTTQMDALKVDYSGMQLKGGGPGVHVDRLILEQRPDDPTGQQRFQQSIEAGIQARRFESEKPHGDLHPGQSDFGVRQNVSRESMQIGIGPEGAFVDIDRYNPRNNVLGHLGEVLMPGETDMGQVARALGIDLSSHP
jgi:hypothetical protein